MSKLSLTDRVEIKNQLKSKLLREIEGFRVGGGEYSEVKKLDEKDLKKITTQIKHKLGY